MQEIIFAKCFLFKHISAVYINDILRIQSKKKLYQTLIGLVLTHTFEHFDCCRYPNLVSSWFKSEPLLKGNMISILD